MYQDGGATPVATREGIAGGTATSAAIPLLLLHHRPSVRGNSGDQVTILPVDFFSPSKFIPVLARFRHHSSFPFVLFPTMATQGMS